MQIPSFLMERGYLVIVAGIIYIGEDLEKICIMKLISPSKVYDTDNELLIKNSEENTYFSIDFENENENNEIEINIFLQINGNIFDFTIKQIAQPLSSTDDFFGGFQWNVNNLIPLGQIEGTILLISASVASLMQAEFVSCCCWLLLSNKMARAPLSHRSSSHNNI